MSLLNIDSDELEDARKEIDNQIAALRERKLAISVELERRMPREEAEPRVVQTIIPNFVESESVVPELSEPDPDLLPEKYVPPRKKRWW